MVDQLEPRTDAIAAALRIVDAPGPLLAVAQGLMRDGVTAPLVPLLDAILSRWPKNERAIGLHRQLVESLDPTGKTNDAHDLAALRKAINGARKASDPLRLTILSDLALGGFPQHPWPLDNALRIANGAGDFAQALAMFRAAPRAAREHNETVFQAYIAAFEIGGADRAALRAEALAAFAASPQEHLWTGRLLRFENHIEGALAAFVRAAADAPDDPIATREVATAAMTLGRVGDYAGHILRAEESAGADLRTAIQATRGLFVAAGGSLEDAAAGREPSQSVSSPATAFDLACAVADRPTYQSTTALLMVGATLAAGGAERILATLFAQYRRALGPDRVRLALFDLVEGEASAFYLPDTGAAASDILIARAPVFTHPEIAWLPRPMAIRAQGVFDAIVKLRPAAVHATLDMVNVCAGYAAVLAGAPRVVLHIHNMRPTELAVEGAFNPDYDHCYRRLLERAEVHLVAVSDAVLDDYLDWIGLPRSLRTHVIANGFDFAKFEQGRLGAEAMSLREEICVDASAPLIGTALRFAELKRPDWWVRIAGEVARSHPDARFVMFGDGELFDETRALANELGLTDRIQFTGRVSNLDTLIGALDLFMLTSRTEGLPNVLIEAQAAGVPVVSFDVGGAGGTFADGKTGRLVGEQSVAAMADAVAGLLAAPDRLRAMGEQAALHVRRCFPVARMVDELGKVLDLPQKKAAHRPVRFIILMQWGRVGSNLVVNIINQSGSVKATNERFNTIRGRDAQFAWYEEHYEIGVDRPSRPVIGTKENVMMPADRVEFARRLRADGVRIIRMRRDDLLKAAVSQMRAELYAAKTREESGQAKWAVRTGEAPLGPTVIDLDLLLTRMAMMDRARTALMDLFAPDEVFDIEYRDIVDDLDAVVRGVRRHLGLATETPFRVPFVKATPDALRSVIVNYEAVAAAVRASPYAAMLDRDL